MSDVHVSVVANGRDYRIWRAMAALIYRPASDAVRPQDLGLLPGDGVRQALGREPWFSHGEAQHLLAFRKGQACGCASVYVDQDYISHFREYHGFFGQLWATDARVGRSLLEQCQCFARQRGMAELRGPCFRGGVAGHGCLCAGFETDPVTGSAWNPAWHLELYEQEGFLPRAEFHAWFLDSPGQCAAAAPGNGDGMAGAGSMERNGPAGTGDIKLDSLGFRWLMTHADQLRRLCNDSGHDAWGFVPWNPADFRRFIQKAGLMGPARFMLGAWVGRELAGICLAWPPKGLKKHAAGQPLILGTLAVAPDFRSRGVDALLIHELYSRGVQEGFSRIFAPSVHNNDHLNRVFSRIKGASQYRTHRIFGKELS